MSVWSISGKQNNFGFVQSLLPTCSARKATQNGDKDFMLLLHVRMVEFRHTQLFQVGAVPFATCSANIPIQSDNKDFFHATLACEDDRVQAHKIILGFV